MTNYAKLISGIFILFFMVCLASAEAKERNVDGAFIKAEDASFFVRGDFYPDIFGETLARAKNCQIVSVNLPPTIYEEPQRSVEVIFGSFAPGIYLKPQYIVTSGEYNVSVSGFLWNVTWAVWGDNGPHYVDPYLIPNPMIIRTEPGGSWRDASDFSWLAYAVRQDNGTQIVVTDTSRYVNPDGLEEDIQEEMTAFNTTLGRLELRYLTEPLNLSAKESFYKGVALYKKGEYEESLKVFDEVIRLSNRSEVVSVAWYNKGLALVAQGKYNEAIDAYDEAIKFNPNDSDPWVGKSAIFGRLGRHDEVVNACDEAIKLDPTNITAWKNKGHALYALGRTTEADETFARVDELEAGMGSEGSRA